MEREFDKKIPKCPVCRLREELAQILGKPELAIGDGEERFFEQMAEEMKERGLTRPEWHFHYDIQKGVVVDHEKIASIPIGSEVPAYGLMTDVCLDCGCVYATDIIRYNSKKPAPIAIPPNRAQRRRDTRGGGLLGPFSPS